MNFFFLILLFNLFFPVHQGQMKHKSDIHCLGLPATIDNRGGCPGDGRP